MTGIRTWFDARSKREQRLLLVMVALAIVTAVWGLIVRPFGDAMASARERHADAVIRLGQTRAELDALRAIRAGRPLTGTLADAVRAYAEQAGFTVASLDPDGAGGLRVAIPSARGRSLASSPHWLSRPEPRQIAGPLSATA